MKNLGLCFLIVSLLFGVGTVSFAKKVEEPVVSTQGVELNANIEKTQTPKDIKNEQKQKNNRSKIYLKEKKKVDKQNFIKRKKQKELEYFEKRLESKKLELDSLTTDLMKGE